MVSFNAHIIRINSLQVAPCTLGPEYEKPEPAKRAVWLQTDWWRSFKNPILDALGQGAITDSYDLNTLFGRIRSAGALVIKTQDIEAREALPQLKRYLLDDTITPTRHWAEASKWRSPNRMSCRVHTN